VASVDQGFDSGGGDADAGLVIFDFLGYADDHAKLLLWEQPWY
jgi:hypothetical protein